MISNKTVEKLPKSSARLTLTVPLDEVATVYASTVGEYAKSVQIRGFRKGHVPVSVLERKLGDGLRIDAMGRVVEAAVEEGLKALDVKPLSFRSPELEGTPDFRLDGDFTFSVLFDVFPEVPVPEWKGIGLAIPRIELSVEDEERELAAIRDRNAIVLDKEGDVARGDVVTVDYREIAPDGTDIPGTSRQDFTFEVGSGYNLYKFDDDIMGMRKEEERVVEKAFAADYEHAELAGRSARIAVRVTKIKEKKLPDLDDEFAQDVSEKFSTLADLVASVRDGLAKRLETRSRQMREKIIVDRLLEGISIDLPDSMVDAELGMRWENFKRQMGLATEERAEEVLASSGATKAALVESWRPAAVKAISTRLVLDRLIEEYGMECTDDDVTAEIERQSKESGLSADEIRAEYEKRDSMEYLRQRLVEDRFFDAVLAAAHVTEGDRISFVDAMKDNR